MVVFDFVRRTSLVLFFFLFVLEVRAQAQSGVHAASTALAGIVVDHAGEVCQGATVRLQQAKTADRITVSDDEGRFHFDAAVADRFTLTVSARGFASKTVHGEIAPGQTLTLPAIELTPSTVSEVRVSAASSGAELATIELKLEEQQRVLGVVPNFYAVYDHEAPALSAAEKFHLAGRAVIDPFNLGIIGVMAGYNQSQNELKGYGQGTKGYALRYGALYGNTFTDTMLGGAVFPALLHQDPRYFYKGTGTTGSRFWYAVANAFVCKGDNGRWQMNYSSLFGDAASAGITNLYYPAGDRGSGGEFVERIAADRAVYAVQNVFQEFVVRHFMRKKPGYGQAQ